MTTNTLTPTAETPDQPDKPLPVKLLPAKPVLLFDGMCPLCQRSVRILKSLDWFKALDYRDCRVKSNWPGHAAQPLEMKKMLEEMHLVSADGGKVYKGFKAFRWLCWKIPATFLLAPLMYIPGVPWIGNKVYLWVAKNRFRLVPCKDGVCQVSVK